MQPMADRFELLYLNENEDYEVLHGIYDKLEGKSYYIPNKKEAKEICQMLNIHYRIAPNRVKKTPLRPKMKCVTE